MSSKASYGAAWFSLLLLAATVFAFVAIPVWLIQPFAPQTENALQISYWLKTWSPLLTLASLLTSAALVIYLWRNTKRWFGKAFWFAPFAVVLVCVWFARQNHFEWMFNPLADTAFAKASETDFVSDDDNGAGDRDQQRGGRVSGAADGLSSHRAGCRRRQTDYGDLLNFVSHRFGVGIRRERTNFDFSIGGHQQPKFYYDG